MFVGAHEIQLALAAVPRGLEDNSAIGCEAGIANGTGAEGDLLILRRKDVGAAASYPPARAQDGDGDYDRECTEEKLAARVVLLDLLGRGLYSRLAGGDVGNGLEVEGKVAR